MADKPDYHVGSITFAPVKFVSGLEMEPAPDIVDMYEQRGDGRWYLKKPPVTTGIGDVLSCDKGSGARFNIGKPPMQYIPLEQQISVLIGYYAPQHERLFEILELLSDFEKGKHETVDFIMEDCLSIEDLHEASYVWEYGSKKYSTWNWAKGMPWSIPLACIGRHSQAIVADEEERDPESGCSHWGHVVCNILMLDHYSRYYRSGDDRPPQEVFSNG